MTLTSTPTVYRQVTITAPVPGLVIVNAAGWIVMQDESTLDGALCSVSQTTSHDIADCAHLRERTATAIERAPFAITRGFNVPAGHTFHLICERFVGGTLVQLVDSALTAIS